MNETTRRFPRSLAEAFPDERACAIERPRRDLISAGHRAVTWISVVGLVLVVFTIAMGVL